jgi:hypothetical protein
MADYIHMMNIIQGKVIEIRERHPLEQQSQMLESLALFLSEQRERVLVEKLRVAQEIDEQESLPIG